MDFYQESHYFHDRADAGKQLAHQLMRYKSPDTVVLAVPRGGVPVAVEVAQALNAQFDLVVTRKIPMPGNPEAGYGAVAQDGSTCLNQPLVQRLGLDQAAIEQHARTVLAEIKRRDELYHSKLNPVSVAGKTAILIDDGLASGYTMIAALKSMQHRRAAKTVVASPVASINAYNLLKPLCDDIVCLVVSREHYFAVASFYLHWYDLTDDDVMSYLDAWQKRHKMVKQS